MPDSAAVCLPVCCLLLTAGPVEAGPCFHSPAFSARFTSSMHAVAKWKFLTALSTDPLSFSANIHYRTALGIIIEHNVFDFGCSPPGNLPLNHSAPLTSAQILDTPCVYTVSRLARQECIIYRPSRRLFRRMSKHTHCHKSIYASASLD